MPDPDVPGLVVTLSTTPQAAGGPNANLAGVFQLNATATSHGHKQVYTDWEVGSPGLSRICRTSSGTSSKLGRISSRSAGDNTARRRLAAWLYRETKGADSISAPALGRVGCDWGGTFMGRLLLSWQPCDFS